MKHLLMINCYIVCFHFSLLCGLFEGSLSACHSQPNKALSAPLCPCIFLLKYQPVPIQQREMEAVPLFCLGLQRNSLSCLSQGAISSKSRNINYVRLGLSRIRESRKPNFTHISIMAKCLRWVFEKNKIT